MEEIGQFFLSSLSIMSKTPCLLPQISADMTFHLPSQDDSNVITSHVPQYATTPTRLLSIMCLIVSTASFYFDRNKQLFSLTRQAIQRDVSILVVLLLDWLPIKAAEPSLTWFLIKFFLGREMRWIHAFSNYINAK